MAVNDSHRGRRIAKNTLMLYIRMLFILLVSFYTSRVVLEALGETDYGMYGVVGGVVAMFTIISGSLSAAITRFITYEMGKGGEGRLPAVFSSAVTIQIILALIVLLAAEPVGIWFIENHLNISPDRMHAAHWVYQFSLLTFVINIISIPYHASIVAHERMAAFSVIGIAEGIAKLAVAFLILRSPIDRLICYSFLMCVVAVGVRIAYTKYCRKHFEECRFRFIWDGKLLKQMFSFAGWNFIGVASGALRDHGGNILMNIFAGTAANAARALSVQLGGAVQNFVTNFMTAVNPQITKSYAADDKEYTMKLVFRSSKFSFYLLLVLALPVFLNVNPILDLWLDVVPEHTASFVRLALGLSLSECISTSLVTLMLATGNIRNYQIIVGGLQLLNLPLSYLLLRAGFPLESVLVVAIVISQLSLFARVFLLKGMTGLKVGDFIRQVYAGQIVIAALSFVPSWWLTSLIGQDFLMNVIVSCCLTVLLTLGLIYLIGLDSSERDMLTSRIRAFLNRK